MIHPILNTIIMVFATSISAKQGLAMINPKQNVLETFASYGVNKAELKILGAVTLLSGLLTLLPGTFVAGNVLMAAAILYVICLKLRHMDFKGFAVELPFIMLNILMIYMQYPVNDFKNK